MIYAEGEFVIDEYSSFSPVMKKREEHMNDFEKKFSSYTSGLVKYVGLPRGTKVRLTLEVIE